MIKQLYYKLIKFLFTYNDSIMEMSDISIKDCLDKMGDVSCRTRHNIHDILDDKGKIYCISNNNDKIIRIIALDTDTSLDLLIKLFKVLGISSANTRVMMHYAEDKKIYYPINNRIYSIELINGFYSIDCVKY